MSLTGMHALRILITWSAMALIWTPHLMGPEHHSMNKPVNVNGAAMQAVMRDLADAAKLGYSLPHVAGSICTAVANLIAGAGNGSAGGVQQVRMMQLAEACGFAPEYWANSIRVTYTPKG